MQSESKLTFQIPISKRGFIPVEVNVVMGAVPLFLVCQELIEHELVLDYVNKIPLHESSWTQPPLSTRGEHMLLEWNHTNIFVIRAKILCLHLHFLHPSSENLFLLLKRARPHLWWNCLRNFSINIENLQSMPISCTIIDTFPSFSIIGRATFQSWGINLPHVAGFPILHVSYRHMKFQSATSLHGKNPTDIWNTFVECLAVLNVRHPNIILIDQEAGFAASLFRKLANAHGIKHWFSRIYFHNAIGGGETYLTPLWQAFRRKEAKYRDIEPETILKYVIKGLNVPWNRMNWWLYYWYLVLFWCILWKITWLRLKEKEIIFCKLHGNR